MNAQLEQHWNDPLWHTESREFAFLCDRAGTVLAADKRAVQRFGMKSGSQFLSYALPGMEEKLRGFLERAAQKPVMNVELALATDGKALTCLFNGKPDGRGGIAVLGCILPQRYSASLHDAQDSMTEVVALNRQIARQKDQLQRTVDELDDSNRGVTALHLELADKAEVLERTSQVKSRLIANVSHEFRTPLHTIMGLSRLLLGLGDGPLTPEQRKQVQYIRASAEELTALVDDMLDLSRAEAGKAILRPQKFNAADFFSALRGTLKPVVNIDPQVQLIFEPTDAQLETDQSKLSQILRNLITNAVKFTERGHVKASLQMEGDDAVFRVEDTGIGIAPEDFQRVFEEFGQVENHLQKHLKGTGLGLALSRRLAELLGGTLTLESEVGKGSTFTLRIPREHPEVHDMSVLQSRPLDPARAPILVVEDDRKTIFIYEKYLAMTGFQVVPARTIADAERLLGEIQPAAIVLDIMLDGEVSWSFLERLKRDPRTHDIPVLVVTVTGKEQKARALGADEFWLKPLDQDRLLRKLKSLQIAPPGTVLAIDDDERSRYLLRKFLDNGPYRLLEAATGAEGLALAREQRPDVILLDFLLVGETAFDVLDELKSDPNMRHIPVILITSHKLNEQERARLSQQTDVILSKESLSRELAINRIRDALRKAQRASTHSAPGGYA